MNINILNSTFTLRRLAGSDPFKGLKYVSSAEDTAIWMILASFVWYVSGFFIQQQCAANNNRNRNIHRDFYNCYSLYWIGCAVCNVLHNYCNYGNSILMRCGSRQTTKSHLQRHIHSKHDGNNFYCKVSIIRATITKLEEIYFWMLSIWIIIKKKVRLLGKASKYKKK